MSNPNETPGARLMTAWRRLSPWPGGTWLFSRLIDWMVPYTGSIGAQVVELRQGYTKVELSDRRKVRNHLRSIHAIALANLGEACSGLAMLTFLPPGIRGIVTQLSIEYLKKARGRLVAEASVDELPRDLKEDIETVVYAVICDESGDKVARVTVTWQIGPLRK